MTKSFPEHLDPEKFPQAMSAAFQEEVAGNLDVQKDLIGERNQITQELAGLISSFEQARMLKDDGEVPKSFLSLVDEGLKEAQKIMGQLNQIRKMRAEEIKDLRQEVDKIKEKYKIPLKPSN